VRSVAWRCGELLDFDSGVQRLPNATGTGRTLRGAVGGCSGLRSSIGVHASRWRSLSAHGVLEVRGGLRQARLRIKCSSDQTEITASSDSGLRGGQGPFQNPQSRCYSERLAAQTASATASARSGEQSPYRSTAPATSAGSESAFTFRTLPASVLMSLRACSAK